MVGSVIENYKVVSVLGEGGMGVVYKALDMKLERFVALKILSTQSANNPQFIERFKREAKNQAKLNHPNIVPVYGFTDENGILGIAMEYVEGVTLEKMISRKKRLETAEALKILKQMLEGVAYAHSKGFIHRDIKPSNIIINREGTIKIMDFGISKSMFEKGITKTGTKIGTILYMSPEQIRAEEPTRQSDIYSIGISFYEMLVGKTPFDLGTEYEIMEAHLKKNPGRVSVNLDSVPPEIDKIVAKSLEKVLQKRYSNCEEFLEDVDALLKKVDKTKPVSKKNSDKNPKRAYHFRVTVVAIISLSIFTGLSYLIFTSLKDIWPKLTHGHTIGTETTEVVKPAPLPTANSNWVALASQINATLNSVYFIDNTTGFACGENGTIIMSSDAGLNWQKLNTPHDVTLNDLYFFDSKSGITAGEHGEIFRTDDGGLTWRPLFSGASETLFRIFPAPNGNIFITGSKGLILRSIDNGMSWIRGKSVTDKILYSISFADVNTGFAVGWNGTILKTNDGGASWVTESSFTDKYLRDIEFVDNSNGFVCGAGGDLFKTTDRGASWKKLESGTFSGLSSIHFINKNRGFVSGNKGEILETTDGGVTWKLHQGGGYMSLSRVVLAGNAAVYVCGYNGIILKNSL